MRSLRLLVAPAACAAMLALAACGSGAGPVASAQTGSGPGPGAVTFAKCMRTHGVPQFPDPGGPAPPGSSVSILGAALPPTINIQAPTFQSALNTCMKPPLAKHPRPKLTAAKKAAALKFSECMRAHGVPHFPDPQFTTDGGIGLGIGPGDDPDSPSFQHAQKVCGNP
jgi:hypothetical protein